MSGIGNVWVSYEEQLALLQSKGLEITQPSVALSYLGKIGYHRLSAYWHPLEVKTQSINTVTNIFVDNAKFEDAVALYVFDKNLRLLVLDAIERIEIAVRVKISHVLGEKDPFAHRNIESLDTRFTKKIIKGEDHTPYQIWLSKLDANLRRSRDEYIKKHKGSSPLKLPIWISVELWDFGLLSKFFSGMKVSDRVEIATQYNIPSGRKIKNWQLLSSWLRTINYVRNVAAHHSRLWNRNLVDQSKMLELGIFESFDHLYSLKSSTTRVYSALCILAYLLRQIYPNSSWFSRVNQLITSFPSTSQVSIKQMGFPQDWKSASLWH